MLGIFVFGFCFSRQKAEFDEIDAERINAVEKDCKLRMFVSNQERQHVSINKAGSVVWQSEIPK